MYREPLHLLIVVSFTWHCYVVGFRLGKCRKPKPPLNAVLSASSQLRLYRHKGFPVYNQVRFQCKVGYKPHGPMWSLCGKNGRWMPNPRDAGRCVYDRRRSQSCGRGQFRCQTNGECIDARLRCDCTLDCSDGSDEKFCRNPKKIIVGTEGGKKATGALTSPGYPKSYPSKFTCTYSLVTDENHLFKVALEEIDLRLGETGKCRDFIRMSGVHRPVLSNLGEDIGTSKSDLDLSMVICGRSNPGTVISNSSSLDLYVSLDGGIQVKKGRKTSRGFALTWQLVHRDSVMLQILKQQQRVDRTRKVNFINENYVTVVVPIIISAIVPVTLIAFMCRKQKRGIEEVEPSNSESSQESDEHPSDKNYYSEGGERAGMTIFYDLNNSRSADRYSISTTSELTQEPVIHSGTNIIDDSASPPHCREHTISESARCHHSCKSGQHGRQPKLPTTSQKLSVPPNYIYEQEQQAAQPQFQTYNKMKDVYYQQRPKVAKTTYSISESSEIVFKEDISSRRLTNDDDYNFSCQCRTCNVFSSGLNGTTQNRSLPWRQNIVYNGRDNYDSTIDYSNFNPYQTSCGFDHNRKIPSQGLVHSERFVDGNPLVAKQQTSYGHTTSETETETTKSSLV